MGRILVLSDREKPAAQLRKDIESMGHNAISASFDSTAEAVDTRKPDVILADLSLPGEIAEVWRQLRYDLKNSQIPAVALISIDRIGAVEQFAGMDDFILYPYSVCELEMRIKLTLRRQRRDADARDIIRIGNLTIDEAKYEIAVDGQPIVLTLKEYELLRYLATRQGRVITRRVLLDQVWGYDYYGGTRTVDVHIGRLRTKIETADYSFIKTVRGVGYIFTAEDRSA